MIQKMTSLMLFFVLCSGCSRLQVRPDFQRSPTISVLNLGDQTRIDLPEKSGRPAILIFWHTWCRPCRIEMDRLKRAVQAGRVPGMQVYAVAYGEELSAVQDYVLQNDFPFQFFTDPENQGVKQLGITGTPTIYHLNIQNEIVWENVGLAGDSIERASRLFQ